MDAIYTCASRPHPPAGPARKNRGRFAEDYSVQMPPASSQPFSLASFERPLTAMVTGSSRGIGLAFVRRLAAGGQARRIWAGCRDPASAAALARLAGEFDAVRVLELDITVESSIAAAARVVAEEGEPLDLVINCAGFLHRTGGPRPERRLAEVRLDWLLESFAVNAAGPLLLAKHIEPLLPRRERAVFASLSARVGSIGDNHLGGWYGYRGAKAAQNMFIRTLSIEIARRARGAICVALHPGTTDTDLSRPFQGGVPPGALFTTERAVDQLLRVIDGLGVANTGGFYAWNGEKIPW
jgi:NAD(P)-dependent dehydrogenase (short-subunit alcohol dehydrogenase family)